MKIARNEKEDGNSLDLANLERGHVVRQPRIALEPGDGQIIIDGKTWDLIDCTPFGVAVLSDEKFRLDDFLKSEEIFFGVHVNWVHIKKVREQFTEGIWKTAFEVLGEPVQVEKIKAIKESTRILREHKLQSDEKKKVPEKFRRVVFEMKDWLLSLKQLVDRLQSRQDHNRVSEVSDFDTAVANQIGDYIVSAFGPAYKILEAELKGIKEETRATAFEFFRAEMKGLLLDAPFFERSYTKPLGYAGDYQMMNQIYAKESLGNSLFGKCLHLYFVSAPESRAVRNRARYLQGQILQILKGAQESELVKIMSVASGPAMEIQNLILENPNEAKKAEFILLDQDLESLEYAQKRLRYLERSKGVKVNIKYIHRSIKSVIAGGLHLKDFDLIYSAGLFDYFSDPVAQIASQKLFDGIKGGGSLIIGNFNISSPGRITMDMALDWHLIYRSHSELMKLYGNIADDLHIEQEEESINLFCHLRKGQDGLFGR